MLNLTTATIVLGLALLAGVARAATVKPHEFFVAPDGSDRAAGKTPDRPFATLARARDAVRKLKAGGQLKGPVTVRLRGGDYPITEPVVFGPEDSGTAAAPITYAAYAGERPVLHGGRRITGWKPDPERKGAWAADLPEVKAGQWRFRQLFVSGTKRPRARTPKEGFLRVAGFPEGTCKTVNYHTDCQSFEFKPGDIDPAWTNLDDVEVIVYHFWTDSHLPIKSIDTKTHIVTFKHKAGKVFTDDFSTVGARYIVENVFEALDQPGEWYLNRKTGRLYYIPLPGEDMAKAEVVAPVAEAHIRIEGDALQRQPVEHLTFRNLSFAYTNWHLPPGNSNDNQGSASVPAAIILKGARHCAFEHCRVSHLGTSAFELLEGCTANRFVHNHIAHAGAGGFRVNGGGESSHPLLRTGHNIIADNHIDHYGTEYPSAVGILLMHTEGNTVAHNDIHHGYYTGISIGWHWGYQRSISRGNRIEHNHIHHIGQGLLSDMGAIYTLGVSPGTVIRNNLIHDVDANHYGGWGIYNDEGSSHLLIENNVVYNTKFAGYNIHYAKEVTVRNNIFAFGRLQQLSRSRAEPHKSCFFERNIVYWTDGTLLDGNWRDKAHSFYFRPSSGDKGSKATHTFDADWNLYYNPKLKLDQVKFNNLAWASWQKTGKDRNSAYADPLFVDAAKRDFRLRPESPAFALGFKPIDVSTAGPRGAVGPEEK
ncbi:right-handed parallel beta-helix repeat-containing protein [bacterium]|nr:right-handed parallel beta-helix repeat-containing protein [bacterium]